MYWKKWDHDEEEEEKSIYWLHNEMDQGDKEALHTSISLMVTSISKKEEVRFLVTHLWSCLNFSSILITKEYCVPLPHNL